jgi:hypothetical protein
MSTFYNWARLSFRLQRLEVLLLSAAVVVAAGLMAWLTIQLDGLAAANPGCDFHGHAESCQAAAERFGSAFGSGELAISGTSLVTFGVGLFLGVPLVAREVETGTAHVAWTISASRVRWLVYRVAFAMLISIVFLGTLAVTTDVLAAAMRPDLDTSESFWFYGGRGPLLVGRGLLALGAGVLIGAMIGKQLPALLMAALALGSLTIATEVAFGAWHATEAVLASDTDHLSEPLGISSGIELPSGERVGYGGAEFQDENGVYYASEEDFHARRNPLGREYQLIIPGARYGEIVARETAVLTAAGLLLIGGAAAVTSRRRPT